MSTVLHMELKETSEETQAIRYTALTDPTVKGAIYIGRTRRFCGFSSGPS